MIFPSAHDDVAKFITAKVISLGRPAGWRTMRQSWRRLRNAAAPMAAKRMALFPPRPGPLTVQLWVSFLSMLALFANATSTAEATASTAPSSTSSQELGVWFWNSPYAMTLSNSQRLIDQTKANGFNAIYVTVDDYLVIASGPPSPQKTTRLQAYDAAVEKFITYANQNGISVDAESGSPDWAEAANGSRPYRILSFVTEYNNTHAAKFRNTQYDVEVYLLSTYRTNKISVLTDYIDMVNHLVTRNTSGGGIEMVVPFFCGQAPNITYNGQTGSTFTLLLSALDKVSGDAMIMMAYRNYASGRGGTLDISDERVAQASRPGHSTKLIIAQETGNVQPS